MSYRVDASGFLIDDNGTRVGFKELDGDEVFFPRFNADFTSLVKPDGNDASIGGAASVVTTPYDMPAFAVDVTKALNRISLASSTATLTFSSTPADGSQFELQIVGHSAACTVTIPSCYSEIQQAAITSFVVPANAKLSIFFARDASVTRILGEPIASESAEESVASAATTSIASTLSRSVKITGTTTITSFGTAAAGTFRYGYFAGALTLTNGSSLNIAGGANVVTAAGDMFLAWATAADTWRVMVLKKPVTDPQTLMMSFNIRGALANQDYLLMVDAKYAITITEVTTQSTSGTCTATFKINSTALGGTANSVSNSKQSQAHSSNNVMAAADTLKLTVSANSSCLDCFTTIKYTRAVS